jgi:RNA polymerase sigma-70 factor (ECF subfamily)
MNFAMSSPQPTAHTTAALLADNLAAFRSFARSRLQDDELAADAVQESMLRALRANTGTVRDGSALAWFYRILRNVLIDMHRRQCARSAATHRYASEMNADQPGNLELERVACRCFESLLATLRPDYARILELSDLRGQTQEKIAETLHLSRSNIKVRLHRARRQLRSRLESVCQACASSGCLNCTCEPSRA